MSVDTLERQEDISVIEPALPVEIDFDDDDLTFDEAMHEAMKEFEDIQAHPEKYKSYDSFKELLRDCGIDVSDIPDR